MARKLKVLVVDDFDLLVRLGRGFLHDLSEVDGGINPGVSTCDVHGLVAGNHRDALARVPGRAALESA